nr:predicted protein [Ipomoea batatas]
MSSMVEWLGLGVTVVRAQASHNMVEPPRPHLVTVHYHSIHAEFPPNLFLSTILDAFQVTPYHFTPNAHKLITCFLTRCREVKVLPSLALFMRLFRIAPQYSTTQNYRLYRARGNGEEEDDLDVGLMPEPNLDGEFMI